MGNNPMTTDELVKKGKESGFVTYEELNENLPDDVFTASKIDAILVRFDALGIELIDEAQQETRGNLSHPRLSN